MDPEPDPQLPSRRTLPWCWLVWIGASVFLPALPWLLGARTNADIEFVVAITALALVGQLCASIILSVSVAREMSLRRRGRLNTALTATGLTVVFMLASVAIGVCVWLAGCASVFTLKS